MKLALPHDVKILSKQTGLTQLQNGSVQAILLLSVEENIGITRGIDGE